MSDDSWRPGDPGCAPPPEEGRSRPRRFHLIGGQGAGKTTVARHLGDRLGIPVHHLDELVRDPDSGQDRAVTDLRTAARQIAASPEWVTEGLHAGWTGALFATADRVVWLDTVGRVRATARVARRFAANGWSETRRRGWRGVVRPGAYTRHLRDLGSSVVAIASSERGPTRDIDGAPDLSDLDRLRREHPERLVHCRTQADVDAFLDEVGAGPASASRSSLGLGAAGLVRHLRDPMFWHAYLLLLNTAITSALGVLYWLLVARLYPQAEVGRNAAVIASLTFVAGAAQLNLRPVLARFVPVGGRHTGRLLLTAYAAAATASVVLSLGYLLLSPLWTTPGPVLEIRASPWLTAAFVAATVLWTQFAIQDGALIGFRATVLLTIENTAFSGSKILVVVLLAATALAGGAAITVSWILPIAVAVVVISILTVWRILPDHVRARPAWSGLPRAGRAVRYAAGDYLGSLFALAFSSLIPVIVLNQAGAEASARFYIVWVISTAMQLIPPQMVTSLVVDTARDPDTFAVQGRRMLLGILRILVPLVALLVVTAPLVLSLFGGAYAAEATLLRLLALSSIPFTVISLYIGFARVATQARRLVVVEAVVAVMLLGLTQVLLPQLGLVGVGYAFLVTYSLVAAILLGTGLRPLLRPSISPASR